MRKIIVTEFMTLDGVMEAPGGNETVHPNGGWQPEYGAPDTGKYKVDELGSVGALLLGRKTYDLFAGYWPGQAGSAFGDRMNQLPKYVVSASLEKTEWNNSIILKDVVNEVAELKTTSGGDILVYGSATLVKSLLQNDLVDELRLMLFPVSIGGGLRLFDDDLKLKKFKLKHSQVFESGVVVLEYQTIDLNS